MASDEAKSDPDAGVAAEVQRVAGLARAADERLGRLESRMDDLLTLVQQRREQVPGGARRPRRAQRTGSPGESLDEVLRHALMMAHLRRLGLMEGSSDEEEEEEGENEGPFARELALGRRRWVSSMDEVQKPGSRLAPGTLVMLAKDLWSAGPLGPGKFGVVLEDDGTDVPYKFKELVSGEGGWCRAEALVAVPQDKAGRAKFLANKHLASGAPDFLTGDRVTLSDRFREFGDAQEGPLKPGDVGVVMDKTGDHAMVKELAGDRVWFYNLSALRLVTIGQPRGQSSDIRVGALVKLRSRADAGGGALGPASTGLVVEDDGSSVPFRVKDLTSQRATWYKACQLQLATPSQGSGSSSSPSASERAVHRNIQAREVQPGARVQLRGLDTFAGVPGGSWGTITAVTAPDLFRADWDDGRHCYLSRDQVWISEAGALTQIAVGARVRVKLGVKKPAFEWGNVKPGSIGLVRRLKSDGGLCIVNFPEQPGWRALLPDLEVVPIGGAVSCPPVVIGARVWVKPGLAKPSTGWGRITSGSIGTVKLMTADGRYCMIDFPEQGGWVGLVEEVEVVSTAVRQAK